MGYKLAGYDVIGCNEIDPRMNSIYVENHHPKHNFLCDIKEMLGDRELPEELYHLDILDGSPPCSSFSMAGSRDETWGKMKKFQEGQKEQVLDLLFFDFIALAKKLQPKIVVAENVKGILLGDAIDYVRRIYEGFEDAGYYCQHWLLNAKDMGVPQSRERVFFVGLRKDVSKQFLKQVGLFDELPWIDMAFSEIEIPFEEVKDAQGVEIKGKMRELWEGRQYGDISLAYASERLHGKVSFFTNRLVYDDKPCCTLTSNNTGAILYDSPMILSTSEVEYVSTFPQDYNFLDQSPHYVCGMSVPPVMMAQIASRIYEQWLSKI